MVICKESGAWSNVRSLGAWSYVRRLGAWSNVRSLEHGQMYGVWGMVKCKESGAWSNVRSLGHGQMLYSPGVRKDDATVRIWGFI